jgi:hypothetical protein
MKRGIVLEVDEDFITLLTPEGEFIQVKKEGTYQIGEEIEKLPIQRQRMKKKIFRFSSFKMALTSMVAVCFLVFTMFSGSTSNKVYAYLSIDINPSIEIAVNRDLKVVKIKGYNQDGKMIVTRLSDWQGEPFVDITKEIIELSIKNGYLQEGEEVLITTVKKETNRSSSQQLVKELNEVKQSYKAKDIIVTTKTSTLEVRKEAVEKGFTTGKYLRLTEKVKEKRESNLQSLPSDEEGKKEVPTVPSGSETDQAKDTVPSQLNNSDTKEQREQWNPSQQVPSHVEEKEEQFGKVQAPPFYRPEEKKDKFQEKEEKEQKEQEKKEKKLEQKQGKREREHEQKWEKRKREHEQKWEKRKREHEQKQGKKEREHEQKWEKRKREHEQKQEKREKKWREDDDKEHEHRDKE